MKIDGFIRILLLCTGLYGTQTLQSATSTITFCGDGSSEGSDYRYVWAGIEDGTDFISDNTILCSNAFCRNKYTQEGYPSYPITISINTQLYDFFDFDIYAAGWTNVGLNYPSPGYYYLAINGDSNPYLSTISCLDAVSHALSDPEAKKKNAKK